MARLLVKTDGVKSPVIELNLGVNRVGRGSGVEFRIEHPTISSVHCEFVLSADAVLLRDCDSTNGTFVDGEPVKEKVLHPGQTVHLGDVELFVETTDVKITIPKISRPVPAPPVVRKDGSMLCRRHPEAEVTHRCTRCHEVLCDACVHRLRRRGGKLLKLCPLCSYPCEPFIASKSKRKSLLKFLKETVRLPFTHLMGRDKP